MIAHFPKQTISIKRRGSSNQLTVSGSKREKNSIVQILVIWDKICFFDPDYFEGWTPNCVRVVWKSFNRAAIRQSDPGLLYVQSW